MRIRNGEPADYERVIAVIDEWWGGRPMQAMLPRLFFVHFRETCFVADDDGGLAGFICGFLSPSFPDEAYIHFVGVAPAERGSGLGRDLYERFFEAALAGGRSIVRCVTSPANEGSLRFHRSLGFSGKPVPGYDGAGEDRVVLEKRLPAAADVVVGEFTHQAEAFNASPTMNAHDTLGALVELVPVQPGERWLESACGPGIVSRALAPRVGSVHGVDLTPAMVELARREAAAAGVSNATFAVGDATALELADGSFAGAATRFSLHHIPRPARVVSELARVVRPGGLVVVADHVTSGDPDVAAWHQEIERLRDPSHWACLTPAGLRRLGEEAGLTLETERLMPLSIDYEEWLGRGSGGPAASRLVEDTLAGRPGGDDVFRVVGDRGERRLELTYWLSTWRRG